MAKLKITVDVFSGRENPVIELDNRAADEALERLRIARGAPATDAARSPVPSLGYRGLIIEQERAAAGLPTRFRVAHGDVVGARLAGRASDETFEQYLFSDLLRRDAADADVTDLLRKEFARAQRARTAAPARKPRAKVRGLGATSACRCAPLYEPLWWNVPAIQPYNNCYNYATNYRTDTFAQPGRAAGAMYTALTCASVRPAAIADQLINQPRANNRCPKEGHLVALVIWPGGDYHWYRKGRTGAWSHKPGGTPVTDLDNAGVAIADPRIASRGPYTVFCTFMVAMHGHIKIS